MLDAFDAYYTWLGIAPEEQPPNYYRLLGIRLLEDNAEVIAHAADRQMAHLRTFQTGSHAADSQRLLNEVAAARVCLLSSEKRAAYAAELASRQAVSARSPESSGPAAGSPGLDLARFLGDVQPPGHRSVSAPQRSQPNHSRRIFVSAAVAGVGLLAVLMLVLSRSRRPSEACLTLDWPERDRSGATLQIDGEMQAVAGSGRVSFVLSPQDHRIVIRRPECDRFEKCVTLEAGATQSVAVRLAPLQPVLVIEWPLRERSGAFLEIDGKRRELPQDAEFKVALAAGKHRIHMTRSGFKDIEQGVTLVAGRTSRLTTDWIPEEQPEPATVQSPQSTTRPEEPKPKETVAQTPPVKPEPEPGVALPEKPRKASPPDEVAMKTALGLARELHQEEIDRPNAAGAKRVLKNGAAAQAGSVDQFVLLRVAREIAVAADDARTAMEAIDRMAESYEIDGPTMKAETLAEFAGMSRSLADRKALAEQMLAAWDEAAAQENFAVARQLAKMAQAEVAKTRDRILIQQVRNRTAEMEETAKAFAAVETARDTIRKQSDEPEANTTLGKYLCFVRGDWVNGLPYLAKGNDPQLRPLAEQELKGSSETVDERLRLADGWWSVAQRLGRSGRGTAMLRAGYWYRQATAELDSPLILAKIDGRLQDVAKVGRTMAEPPVRPGSKNFVNPIGMKMILVPSGNLLRGRDKRSQRADQVPKPFYLSASEVTETQYGVVMARPADGGPPTVATHVNWREAAEFCNRLSAVERLPPFYRVADKSVSAAGGPGYRLPSAVEWDYAISAGDESHWKPLPDAPDVYAWFAHGRPYPGTQRRSNPFGIYKLAAIWEYEGGPGSFRGWLEKENPHEAGFNNGLDYRAGDITFRVAREAPGREAQQK
jgi:formylglycine-generating enzyme required for sulfatase activity